MGYDFGTTDNDITVTQIILINVLDILTKTVPSAC